jgi:hypothetical protein
MHLVAHPVTSQRDHCYEYTELREKTAGHDDHEMRSSRSRTERQAGPDIPPTHFTVFGVIGMS